jgi:hypothetical protein
MSNGKAETHKVNIFEGRDLPSCVKGKRYFNLGRNYLQTRRKPCFHFCRK